MQNDIVKPPKPTEVKAPNHPSAKQMTEDGVVASTPSDGPSTPHSEAVGDSISEPSMQAEAGPVQNEAAPQTEKPKKAKNGIAGVVSVAVAICTILIATAIYVQL